VEIMPEELEYRESVGTGATAEVFRGYWNGELVAIKQIYLKTSDRGRSELKQQVAFTREVAVMSMVSHENLVKFYGVCMAERPLRIVTEFCEGNTLFQFLHGEEEEDFVDITWTQKLKMCLDIAKAMHYLHTFQPQIIHRDLKSLNLLLARAVTSSKDIPLVKVSDFGLARMKDAHPDSQWVKMTKDAGTCHWMAPEVQTGRYDEKADVYSYAMVMFEIICRAIPWEDEAVEFVAKCTMRGERPDMEELPPDCPPSLEQLMVACWAQKPEDRPPFVDIKAALEKLDVSKLGRARPAP